MITVWEPGNDRLFPHGNAPAQRLFLLSAAGPARRLVPVRDFHLKEPPHAIDLLRGEQRPSLQHHRGSRHSAFGLVSVV